MTLSPSDTAAMTATRARSAVGWRVLIVFVGYWASGVLIQLSVSRRDVPGVMPRAVLDHGSWAVVAALCAVGATLWLRRPPTSAPQLVVRLVLASASALVLIALRFWLTNAATHAFGWTTQRPSMALFTPNITFNVLYIAGLIGMGFALAYHAQVRDNALATAQLAAQLAQARYTALTLQLNPHFLFNALNAVATLVRRDPIAAERAVTSLSRLLRAVLTKEQRREISLAEELELLHAYVEIERARFSDWLTIRTAVPTELSGVGIPPLTLQPIVENAIKHGIARLDRPGVVEVTGARLGEQAVLRVSDDGVGFSSADPAVAGGVSDAPGGFGLSSVRERLDQLYGSAASMRVGNRQGGGAEVELRLPLRFANEKC